MDKKEYQLHLNMLKMRGKLANQTMVENVRRRENIKFLRHHRSDEIKSLLAWKNTDVLIDELLVNAEELAFRERVFGK